MAPKSLQKCSRTALGELLEQISLRKLNFEGFEGLQGGPWEVLVSSWGCFVGLLGSPWGPKGVLLGALGHHFASPGGLQEGITPQKQIFMILQYV